VHAHINARQFGERALICDSSACVEHSCCVEKIKVLRFQWNYEKLIQQYCNNSDVLFSLSSDYFNLVSLLETIVICIPLIWQVKVTLKKRFAYNAFFKLEVIGYAEINVIYFIPILTQKIRVLRYTWINR